MEIVMSRYIVNTTTEDGTDLVTLTDFAHEAAFVAMEVKSRVRLGASKTPKPAKNGRARALRIL